MPIVDMKDMLLHAYRHGYAVGAFDEVSLDFVEGLMAAAENCRAPVILSLAESHFEYFDFELIMPSVVAAARRATVPVSIHLDHGASLGLAVRAIRLSCNGVMVDASAAPSQENISVTRTVVEMAHSCGVAVEGELGYVPGIEGEDAARHPGEAAYTSPGEARAYVTSTGVDSLAVSIGTVHGRMRGTPKLDFARLAKINEAAGVPLVIHGGTGLSDAAAKRIRENAAAHQSGGYTTLLEGAKQAICAEVERCIKLWGSGGRSAEVLA
jgi:fructose-bisphosphate aldolase class II